MIEQGGSEIFASGWFSGQQVKASSTASMQHLMHQEESRIADNNAAEIEPAQIGDDLDSMHGRSYHSSLFTILKPSFRI